MANKWTGTTWLIEGDISDCFGSIDHQKMVDVLSGKMHDSRFLRLLRNMLQAGYLEDWIWNATLSGVPQGGVVSPILSNIYLDRLDKFVETVLVPEYTRGDGRARNPAYREVEGAIARARRCGDRPVVRQLRKQLRSLPSLDPQDPGYRRLRYVRYCDDHLLGFIGPKAEAEEIKTRRAPVTTPRSEYGRVAGPLGPSMLPRMTPRVGPRGNLSPGLESGSHAGKSS